MKKFKLACAIVLFGLSNAQIQKGTGYLSGTINYTQQEDKNIDLTEKNFKVIPTAGLFVAPNLAVGAGLGYINRRTEHNYDSSYGSFINFFDYTGKTNALAVAPFIRKYWNLSDKLYFFGQLEIPMEFGKINQDAIVTTMDGTSGVISVQTLSVERKYTSVGVNVKPGLDYFLSKNWSVEATVGEFGYRNFKYKNEDDTDRKNYKAGLNLSAVSFGVKYVFAK